MITSKLKFQCKTLYALIQVCNKCVHMDKPFILHQAKSASLEHDQDQMLYNSLNTLLKILRECRQVLTSSKWESNMNVIWGKFKY